MSGIASTWAVNADLSSLASQRLVNALAVSLLAHALILNWPVHVPAISLSPGDGVSESRLRVSLKPPAPDVVPASAAAATPEPALPAPATDPVPPAAAPQALEKPGGAKEPESPKKPADASPEPDSIALLGYYAVSKLSRMPEAIGRFDIRAPAGGDTGLGGKMTIRVWISVKGDIDRVRVIGSGLPEDYAEAALAAFRRLRFEPGEIDGMKVASWADIVIEYADFQREPPMTGAERGLAR